jgi:hypothetical protein
MGGEGRNVNVWIGQIKNKKIIMFLLEVSYHVEGSFEMSFIGISKMGGKERYFGHNADAAKLNHPTHHTNKVLVE